MFTYFTAFFVLILLVKQTYLISQDGTDIIKLDSPSPVPNSSNQSCLSKYGNCFCDELCLEQNDCCHDYTGLNRTQPDTIKPHPPIMQCVHSTRTFADDPSLEKYDSWFQAVAKCPPDTPSNLADLCNQAHTKRIRFMTKSALGDLVKDIVAIRFVGLQFWILKSDIRSMAPVVSKTTGRVYANIHCAECYGEVNLTHTKVRDTVKAAKAKLDYFDIDIKCRRDDQESRLCFARSSLPRSLSRPCRERLTIPVSGSQIVFSQSDFSWEELLIVPDHYYDDDLENATLPELIADSIYNIMQTIICLSSALALMILVGVYAGEPTLRSRLSCQLTIGLSIYLIGLLVIYLIIPLQGTMSPSYVRLRCMFMAGLLLYFFLGSFVWMAVFGVNLMHTFGGHHAIILIVKQIWSRCSRNKDTGSWNLQSVGTVAMKGMVISSVNRQKSKTNKRLWISSLLAVLTPFTFVIPAIIINEEVYPNERLKAKYRNNSERSTVFCTPEEIDLAELTPGFCPLENPTRPWFTVATGWRIWFLTPTTILLVFNCLILLSVGTHIWCLRRSPIQGPEDMNKRSGIPKSQKQMVRICLNLSITLGAVWIFQLLASMMPELPWLNQIASLISGGQGLAITILSLINTRPCKSVKSWSEIVSRRRDTTSTTATHTTGNSKNTESTLADPNLEVMIADR